jgi:hypothetical protein
VPSGGWRLSGRYSFSSGCDHAQWAILGVFLGEMGDPRSIAYLLVPLADVEIVFRLDAAALVRKIGERHRNLASVGPENHCIDDYRMTVFSPSPALLAVHNATPRSARATFWRHWRKQRFNARNSGFIPTRLISHKAGDQAATA